MLYILEGGQGAVSFFLSFFLLLIAKGIMFAEQ